MSTIERFAIRSSGRDPSVVRRPKSTRPKPIAQPDLSSLKKAELVEVAEAQGVDTSGTKADIIERLEGDES